MSTHPSLIEWKKLRFLIMDAPKANNLHLYLRELKKHNVVCVVRVCEPTYQASEVEAAGMQVRTGIPKRSPWIQMYKRVLGCLPPLRVLLHASNGIWHGMHVRGRQHSSRAALLTRAEGARRCETPHRTFLWGAIDANHMLTCVPAEQLLCLNDKQIAPYRARCALRRCLLDVQRKDHGMRNDSQLDALFASESHVWAHFRCLLAPNFVGVGGCSYQRCSLPLVYCVQLLEMEYDDGGAPPPEIIGKWLNVVQSTFQDAPDSGGPNAEGPAIAVHCVAGLGRAPVLVAIALIEYGKVSVDIVWCLRKLV